MFNAVIIENQHCQLVVRCRSILALWQCQGTSRGEALMGWTVGPAEAKGELSKIAYWIFTALVLVFKTIEECVFLIIAIVLLGHEPTFQFATRKVSHCPDCAEINVIDITRVVPVAAKIAGTMKYI